MRLTEAVQRKARRQRRREERWRADAQYEEWASSVAARLLKQKAAMDTKWETDFFLSYVRESQFAHYLTQPGASK